MFFCVFFKLLKNNFTYGTPTVIALGFIFGKSLHPFYLTWSTKNIKFSKNISGSIPQNLPETYNSLLLWSNILEACSYEIIGKGLVEVIGKGLAEIIGKGLVEVIGKGLIEIIGKGLVEVIGKGLVEVTGKGLVKIIGKGLVEIIGKGLVEVIGKGLVEVIGKGLVEVVVM